MTDRRYHRPDIDSPVKTELMRWETPPIRSYVFVFESSDRMTKNLDKLAQRVADYSKMLGNPTHLHGLFIVGRGFLFTNSVDKAKASPEDYFHTGYTKDHTLLAFKTSLLHALARFPRPETNWVPAIEKYFQDKPEWTFLKPHI